MLKCKYYIFSDASFDPRSRIGIAGIMLLSDLDSLPEKLPIQSKIIKDTTCTRLEMEAIIWSLLAVGDLIKQHGIADLELYTDCKTAVDLPRRRENLEAKQFRSNKTGELLSNADLYKKFFLLCDMLKPKVMWIKGHMPSKEQNHIDRLFSEVDKATRNELRRIISTHE